MANQTGNNMRLGIFALAGLITLIFAFFMIGKNKTIFGGNFKIKARFSNANGLIKGNNVLYSGIQAGTVKNVEMINDTTIEVTMLIDRKVKSFIQKNAIASIVTEGLMGNKIIQILPSKGKSGKVIDGDVLATRKMVSIDEMLQTLSKTNESVAGLSAGLEKAVQQFDESPIWKLLRDKETAADLKTAIDKIKQTSINANMFSQNLNTIVSDTKNGKGAAGMILTDTAFAANLSDAAIKIKSAGAQINGLTFELDQIAKDLKNDINGKGFLNFLIKDSLLLNKINSSMDNIEKGTDGFNQNMEALKHNFLFRGYFKKLEKEKQSNLKK